MSFCLLEKPVGFGHCLSNLDRPHSDAKPESKLFQPWKYSSKGKQHNLQLYFLNCLFESLAPLKFLDEHMFNLASFFCRKIESVE